MTELSKQKSEDYSSPLLLKVDTEKWLCADVKIMIFGQETKGWAMPSSGEDKVLALMDQYYNFFYSKGRKNSPRNKTFFQGFDRVSSCIKNSPIYKNKSVDIIWNNINKVGKKKGTGVKDNIRDIERSYFNVIAEEIKLLQPDLLIFFTGPNRDGDIKHNLSEFDIKMNIKETGPYGKRAIKGKYVLIDMCSFDDHHYKAIRLYHPAAFGYCTNQYLKFSIGDWLNNDDMRG